MSRPEWLFSNSPLPDPSGRGAAAVKFLNLLTLTEGKFAGQRDWLQPWQARLVTRIYGTVTEGGRRQIRTVYCMIPRGSGKTTLCGGLGLLHLLSKTESEPASQTVIASGDREQASICFNSARRMVQADPRLARITSITDSLKLIRHPASDGILKAVSSESYTKMGMSISCLICDELATWGVGDRDLYNALVSSQGKRDEPITLIITTAGVGRGSICWDINAYAHRVAAGEVTDPTFLPVLFEIEPGTDWRDREAWIETNPAIASGFRSLEEMEISAARAEHIPAQVASFERLYLNRWLDGAAEPWIDMAIWDEGATDLSLDDIPAGSRAWIGLDLASTGDLAAAVTVVEHEDGYAVFPRQYCPADGIRRRSERDGVGYALWAEQGHITATAGSVISYDTILHDIEDLAERFRVTVVLDRWNSTSTVSRLQDLGIECLTFGQGFASMSGAMKETERLILSRQLYHTGCPVLRWNLANVAVAQDPAGNVKPDRAKSREKIDGIVALIMAIGVAAGSSRQTSVYEERPSFLMV